MTNIFDLKVEFLYLVKLKTGLQCIKDTEGFKMTKIKDTEAFAKLLRLYKKN